MKILIITHYFPPHRGGIENVAYSQARGLAELGHEVRVVTSCVPVDDQRPPEPFSVIRIPAFNGLERKLGVPYPIFSPSSLSVLNREVSSADVVHGHGHVYMPVVMGAQLARIHSKPFVLTQHNTFIGYSSRMLRAVQRLADATLGKLTIKRASAVVAVSRATADYIASISDAKKLVHYNGVDVERFRPSLDREDLRGRLNLPLDKVICFCIRRITFKNGIDTLLEAAELIKYNPGVFFVVGGTGSDMPAVEALVENRGLENVRLLGMVADEDLPDYYAACDIFLLPSKKGEGFPLVVLEALASGLPVVATRSGGHVELVQEGEHGYIVEPNDPGAIADRVLTLCERPDLLTDMKARGRELATQSLSWEKNVERLLGVFKEAMA